MALPKFTFFLGTLFLSLSLMGQSGIQSPDEFLQHKLGEKFTAHHMLVDYFQHVASNSDQVLLQEYGRTNQDRPLIISIISSKNNIDNIEKIRKANLARTGLIAENVSGYEDVAIVWLSMGVHGNEAGASESSIATIYELARKDNKAVQEYLKNVVVILDPCINPDGYSRYTHWNNNVSTSMGNPTPFAKEHDEPWPGGRVNHYLFDLNRDWAWLTQVESQQRIKVYHQWMPHIHADFHEMYHNDPYYFAPAAQPYHKYITKWQESFQMNIGKNHAKYFDQNNWLYFTREIFDLFYPSYGDTYPIFNGAIGMTYEQGGHSNAGRAITMTNGETLHLSDRIEHHRTTAVSTVEVSARNAKEIVKEFKNFYATSSSNPPGEYKSFVIKGDNSIGKIKSLCNLLDQHDIRYGNAKGGSITGYSYKSGKEESVTLSNNDIVINAHQPMAILTQVLFEPEPYLVDSLTYDITAWALPFAYGLDSYAVKNKVPSSDKVVWKKFETNLKKGEQPYAYVAEWNSMSNASFLGALLANGVKVRSASSVFEINGNTYQPGTLIVTRADNRKLGTSFDEIVQDAVAQFEQKIEASTSGFSTTGPDFGSDKFTLLRNPKVGLISGEEVDSYSFGQIWHYFENDLKYPVIIIQPDALDNPNLSELNVLIMPEGRYSSFDSTQLAKIKEWVQNGGKLIAVGTSVRKLEGQEGFRIKKYATSSEKNAVSAKREKLRLANRTNHYSEQERANIINQIPGAIFKVQLDNTHPLAYGFGKTYHSLKTRGLSYELMKDVWNVGYITDQPEVIGFTGHNKILDMKNTTVFATHSLGGGQVVYLIDNPLFRGFWEQGKFLFSNALFMVE